MTLGKFDGLHRGHMKIFRRAREIARSYSCNFSVFTFSISPQSILGQRTNTVLTTSPERKIMIEKAGADVMAECPFNDELKNMEAEDFITEVLLKRFKAKAVITGRDFRFGKNRRGNAEILRDLAARYGFYTEAVAKEKDGDRDISSTYIREEIEAGNLETAARLLGYDYFIKGEIVEGEKLGRTIGFPTANIIPAPEKLLPPFGVYSSVVRIGDKTCRSITDIGTKPTVNGKRVGAETFILDFEKDIYGQEISVALLHFMRGEKKFSSVDELKKQLKNDIKERETYEK